MLFGLDISQFRKGAGILAAITLALSPMSAPAQEDANPGKPKLLPSLVASQNPAASPMMAMPLVAALFLEDQEFSSTLVLVNASNENTYATVTVRSLTGSIINEQRISLAASNQARVPVNSLLRQAGSTETRGSIIVEQSPDLMGMAVLAQLSITHQGSPASYIEEELAMPDSKMGSRVLRGVGHGKEEAMVVAISSLAQTQQQVRIECLRHQAGPVSKTIELASNATVIIEACSQGDSSVQSLANTAKRANSDEFDAVGVQLLSSAGPGQFAAFGITRRPGGSDSVFGAAPFTDPKLAASSSTVFAGLPVGAADLLGLGSYKPYVALANFSLRPAHVTVRFSRTSGVSGSTIASDTPVGDINLPPQRTQILPLADLQGDSEIRNSFVVNSDAAPGDIGVSMASKAPGSEGEVELLGKDAQQPENGGAHPWSVAHGNDSTVLIFNHTQQEQRVIATILNGKALWQKLIKLSPLETIALSMNNLIRNQVRDDRQRILPADLVEGEIIWTMSDPKTVTGRLLVSNRIAAMARNFSCSPFPTLCGASLSPTSASIPVNGSTTFSANYSVCLGYNVGDCSGPSTSGGFSPSFSWSGGGSAFTTQASCSGSASCSVTGNNVGTGTLTAQVSYYNCIYSPQAQVQVTPSLRLQGNQYNSIFVGNDPNLATPNSIFATVSPSGGTFTETSSVSGDTFTPVQSAGPGWVVKTTTQSTNTGDRKLTVTYTVNSQKTSQSLNVTARQFAYATNNSPSNTCTLGYGTTRLYTYTPYTHPDKTAVQAGIGLSNTAVTESFSSQPPAGTITGSGALDANSHFTDTISYCSSSPLTLSTTITQTLSIEGYQVRQNSLQYSNTGVTYTNQGPTQ